MQVPGYGHGAQETEAKEPEATGQRQNDLLDLLDFDVSTATQPPPAAPQPTELSMSLYDQSPKVEEIPSEPDHSAADQQPASLFAFMTISQQPDIVPSAALAPEVGGTASLTGL